MVGDTAYGKGRINLMLREDHGLSRPFLHVGRLSLPHPLEPGRRIEAFAPLPPDLRVFLRRIPGGDGPRTAQLLARLDQNPDF